MALQFPTPVSRTVVLWLGNNKSKETLQAVDRTDFGKILITACTTAKWENYRVLGTKQQLTVLCVPVIFVSRRTSISIFTLCLSDTYEQCGINYMYVFPGETHLLNFLRKFPFTSFENKPSHPFPCASNKNKKSPANQS